MTSPSFWASEATDGRTPVELYTFTIGSGSQARVWRFAAFTQDVTLRGLVYAASGIRRSDLRRTMETGKTTLELTMPRTTPIVEAWLDESVSPHLDGMTNFASGQFTTLTILRTHLDAAGVVVGTTPDPNGALTAAIFLGSLVGMTIVGGTATITADSMQSLLDKPVPNIPIQRTCPWGLFDQRCGLDPADFVKTGTITAFTTETGSVVRNGMPKITVALAGAGLLPELNGFPDLEYYNGGTVLWEEEIDGKTVRRKTGIHYAQIFGLWPNVLLTLETPIPETVSEVSLWPGDQKSFNVCRYRFENNARFGGFPLIPDRNPMRDGLV